MMRNKPILVVEDEPLIAMDIETMLEEAGYATLATASVAETLRVIDQHEIAAALVDIQLEGRDCGPVARLLARKGVPFAYVTGFDESWVTRWWPAPILLKPFAIEALLSMINTLSDTPQSSQGRARARL